MKKFAILLVFVSMFYLGFAQTTEPLSYKQQLWQKSKHQRTAGFVLLGTGLAVTVVGFAVATNHIWDDLFRGKQNVSGTGATIAGVMLMAGSIPLFIIAGKNKRLSLRATSFQQFIPQSFEPLTYQRKMGIELKFTQIIF